MNLNLNKNNGEDCGCDNDYQNLVNSSPILSGSQESIFDPGKINSLNNKFNLNIKNDPIVFEKNTQQIPKIDLEVLQQKKINDNNINMNIETNNPPNMNPAFLQQPNNMNAMNNVMNALNNNTMKSNTVNNNPLNSNVMNNNNALNNMNVVNALNAMNNGEIQNISENSGEVDKDGYKMIYTNMNYIFMVVLALAINDIIKFYINRSIKFSNGTHYYFIYYGVAMFVIVVISSKLLQK